MTHSYFVGIAFVVIGLVLAFLALPHKDGNPARWLRWNAAVVVFPGCLMIFYGLGIAVIVSAYLSK